MFDARAYLDTLTPPRFIDFKGRTRVGRLLGADHWLAMQARLRDKGDLNATMATLINMMFPHPWWKFWETSVREEIWTLPLAGRLRACWDFMESQATSMGTTLPAPLGIIDQTLPSTKSDDPSPAVPTPGS